MSFPSTFGSQVSAIMNVLAKAAVAEITKLVEDGTVVLRLEMRQKDNEIQELQRSLKMMEVELCKAQEAVITRAAERTTEQITVGTQVSCQDVKAEEQRFAGHLVPSPGPLSKCGQEAEDSDGMQLRVKCEPADDLLVRETSDNIMSAAATVRLEPEDPDEPIWPLAACGMFEDGSAPKQQRLQMFPAGAEQFSTHRGTEYSYQSPNNTAVEITDGSFSVPVKVKVEVPPVCLSAAVLESVHNEPLRHASQPVVSESQCLPSILQHARLSTALPPTHRSTTVSVDSVNSLRAKRLMTAWRVNQKLFACSVCNKGFPRLSQLEEHKATHQTSKPFRCLECGKSFTQKTRLKSHQSVHTGERPFSCKICGKMFSRQDNCIRHERFHSGLKPFSCGQCGKSFTVQANLKIHQEIHLQGR